MSSGRNAVKKNSSSQPKLKRRLTLPLLTLYGLGVTIGAGIYVLVGLTAAKAGMFAPISFLLAAGVVGFTGFAYSELATRFPVSAGEAAYIYEGFKSQALSLLIGILVVASGVVSSATVSIGAAAYLHIFIPLPSELLAVAVILLVGLVAVWGILESVTIAAIFTLIEIGGLSLVVWTGLAASPDSLANLGDIVPPFEVEIWAGIFSASLLAFFAFVGFEDIANVAEEVTQPSKTLPKGIILTLVTAALIYFVVVSVMVLVVPMSLLVNSPAPLSLVFDNSSPHIRSLFNIVASVATINGALIQVIMASRVLYGLASRGSLPRILANVNSVTRTPLVATIVIVGIILMMALFLPIGTLAEMTSMIVLVVFVFVNLALLRIKWLRKPVADNVFQVPVWVPTIGLVTSILLLISGFLFT